MSPMRFKKKRQLRYANAMRLTRCRYDVEEAENVVLVRLDVDRVMLR